MLRLVYRLINRLHLDVYRLLSGAYVSFVLRSFSINTGGSKRINGFPKIDIKPSGSLTIGDHFALNSGNVFNSIGRNQRSLLSVGAGAKLIIGDNVGMSSVAIVCQKKISFGNNIRIGGNTVIYDTDFHSLKASERTALPELTDGIKRKEIIIGDNVFVGGHSIILKGTTIGEGSIIGAGSVVSGTIPANEIWAGNPAVFVRKNENL